MKSKEENLKAFEEVDKNLLPYERPKTIVSPRFFNFKIITLKELEQKNRAPKLEPKL